MTLERSRPTLHVAKPGTDETWSSTFLCLEQPGKSHTQHVSGWAPQEPLALHVKQHWVLTGAALSVSAAPDQANPLMAGVCTFHAAYGDTTEASPGPASCTVVHVPLFRPFQCHVWFKLALSDAWPASAEGDGPARPLMCELVCADLLILGTGLKSQPILPELQRWLIGLGMSYEASDTVSDMSPASSDASSS